MKAVLLVPILALMSAKNTGYFPTYVQKYLKKANIEYSKPKSKLVRYGYSTPKSIYEKGVLYPVEPFPEKYWTSDCDFNYDKIPDFLCFARNSEKKREAVIFYSIKNGFAHQVLYTGGLDSGTVRKMGVGCKILRYLDQTGRMGSSGMRTGNMSISVQTDSGKFLSFTWDMLSKKFIKELSFDENGKPIE